MIHLAYATHNKQGVQVNGHRARMWAMSEYLDEYNLFSVNGGPPEYNDGDVLIIDSENDDYEHLLSDKVFSVLISDKFGYITEKASTNAVYYVSDYCHVFSPIYDDASIQMHESEMIFTTGKDVKENSWEGGDYVLFAPGSNYSQFWKKAKKYLDWCDINDVISLFVLGDMNHKDFMQMSRESRCVITASGVTAKEMIYQGVPCILVLTAHNQLGNYTYFTYRRMAFSQDTDPSVLADEHALKSLAKWVGKIKKLDITHMLEIIQKLRNIYEADRRSRIELQN